MGRIRVPPIRSRPGRGRLRRACRPIAAVHGAGYSRARRRGRAAEDARDRGRGPGRAAARARARVRGSGSTGSAGRRRSGSSNRSTSATGGTGFSRGRSQSPARDRIAARPPRRRGGSSRGGTSSKSGSGRGVSAIGSRSTLGNGGSTRPEDGLGRSRPGGAGERPRPRPFLGSRLPNGSISGSGIGDSIRSLGSRSAGKDGGIRCRPGSAGSGTIGRGRSVIGRDRWVRLGGRSGSKTSSDSKPRVAGGSGSLDLNSRSGRRSGVRSGSMSRPQPISRSLPRSATSGHSLACVGSGTALRMSSAARMLACSGGVVGRGGGSRSSLMSARPSPKRRGGSERSRRPRSDRSGRSRSLPRSRGGSRSRSRGGSPRSRTESRSRSRGRSSIRPGVVGYVGGRSSGWGEVPAAYHPGRVHGFGEAGGLGGLSTSLPLPLRLAGPRSDFRIFDGRRMAVEILGLDVGDVEEAVAADREVNEGGLDGRLEVDDLPLIDVAGIALVTGPLDVQLLQNAVFDDGDAAFLGLEHIDQHFFLHTVSFRDWRRSIGVDVRSVMNPSPWDVWGRLRPPRRGRDSGCRPRRVDRGRRGMIRANLPRSRGWGSLSGCDHVSRSTRVRVMTAPSSNRSRRRSAASTSSGRAEPSGEIRRRKRRKPSPDSSAATT